METEPPKILTDLIPEVIFDLLARVIPGFTFVSLNYFTIFLNARLSSEFAFPVTTIYQCLLILVASYVVGFLIEIISFRVIQISVAIYNPEIDVIFPQDTNTRKFKKLFVVYKWLFVYKMLGGPFDEQVSKNYSDTVKSVFDLKVGLNNSGDIFRIVSDFIKNYAPSLYLNLLKLHAEAMMFKNLACACIILIVLELFYHGITNPTYLLVLVIISAIGYFGFVNLNSFTYKRTYLTFLALAPRQVVTSPAVNK